MKYRYALVIEDDGIKKTLSIVPVQPFKINKHDASLLAEMIDKSNDEIVEMKPTDIANMANSSSLEIVVDEEL